MISGWLNAKLHSDLFENKVLFHLFEKCFQHSWWWCVLGSWCVQEHVLVHSWISCRAVRRGLQVICHLNVERLVQWVANSTLNKWKKVFKAFYFLSSQQFFSSYLPSKMFSANFTSFMWGGVFVLGWKVKYTSTNGESNTDSEIRT